MSNLFVGEIVGSLGKKAKNRKWRSFVVVQAQFDMTADIFNAIIVDLDPEDYLFPGDYEDLEWNHDHSGFRLTKLFKERGWDLYSVESADMVYLFPDKNW
ncbi:hypothetical protein SEA_CECE_123 [Microbacterium phage Cece]|nr:hypothetical protein SEA_CECE_123 [Microbacterium phage Cece]